MKIEINDNLAIVLITAMVFGMVIFFNYSGINTKNSEDSIIITNIITKIATNTTTK